MNAPDAKEQVIMLQELLVRTLRDGLLKAMVRGYERGAAPSGGCVNESRSLVRFLVDLVCLSLMRPQVLLIT